MGCYPQTNPLAADKIEEVDIILGTNDKARAVELAEKFAKERKRRNLIEESEDYGLLLKRE